MLEAAIPMLREPIHVRVGIGAKHFEDHGESKAIYATGRDGIVVVEATAEGTIHAASIPTP